MTMPVERSCRAIGRFAVTTGLWACITTVALVCGIQSAWAGHAKIRDMRSLLVDGVYRLSARVEFDMDKQVQAALDSGVPLVVDVEMQVVRERLFPWPEKVAELDWRYVIQYHALSQRYIVRNVSTDSQQSFRRMADVLDTLGNIYDVPIIEADRLKEGEDYRARMRVAFDVESLPTPIRLWAYFHSDWKLTGGWYQWRLTR
jgi:hypothetical protein